MHIPSNSIKKKRKCFCQVFISQLKNNRKNLPLSIYPDKTFLQELKKRLKSGNIKFDYDGWDREIGLICEDYEFSFAELGLD